MTDEKRKDRSNGITPSKLLSVVVTGRDDDYIPDYKYRITTSINYIARNLRRLGRLNDVEILVTDWGSKLPMAQSLPVSPEAGRVCRFVYVPPSVVRAVQNGKEDFHITISLNAGLRRARGEFLMIFAADTMMPQQALAAVLKLLDGTLNVPMAVDRTYFLLSRYQVPWQFVQRQPNLDEWDRYLLLTAGAFDREPWAISNISSAMGALMMHWSLLHELRGLDERLGGWGFNDIDLGLRVSQRYTWVELSSIGVSLFHMEHCPHIRRASIKQKENPHLYNPSFQTNSENWGLGDYELEIQTSQKVCIAEDSAQSIISTSQKVAPWDQSCQEILTELTSPGIRAQVKRVTSFFMRRWEIGYEDMDALFFLAWYSQYHYPRRYLEFGAKQGDAVGVVAFGCPSVEIYAIDRWEGTLSRPALEEIAKTLRRGIGHSGYVRFINGDISTAVQRLRDSFIGAFFFDLVLIRGDLFGADAVRQVSDLLPHLAAGGALILTCSSDGGFAPVWQEIQRQSPQFTYLRCKNRSTGLVLAASLRDGERKGPDMENLVFDTSWLASSRVVSRAIRLCRINPIVRQAYRWMKRRYRSRRLILNTDSR